jgi:hypothetical protein
MKSTNKHLEALQALSANGFQTKSGDEVIGLMLPELAAIIVATHRELVKLTWALIVLTLALVAATALQVYLAVNPH